MSAIQKQVVAHCEKLIYKVKSEKMHAMLAYDEVRDLEKYIESVKEQLQPFAIESIKDNFVIGEKKYIVSQKREWEFKHVPRWAAKKAELEEIQKELKANYEENQKLDTSNVIDEFERGFLESGAKVELKESAIPKYSKKFITLEK